MHNFRNSVTREPLSIRDCDFWYRQGWIDASMRICPHSKAMAAYPTYRIAYCDAVSILFGFAADSPIHAWLAAIGFASVGIWLRRASGESNHKSVPYFWSKSP